MWFWTMILCFILAGTVGAIYDVSKAIKETAQCQVKK